MVFVQQGFVTESLVSWASKKQTTISRSSTKYKYRSIMTTVQELEWIKLLSKLSVNVELPVHVYCHNLGATYLMSNLI